MTIQINSDWIELYQSPQAVEDDLHGFKYHGPGIYFEKTETLLVEIIEIQCVDEDRISKNIQVSVWNSAGPNTILWHLIDGVIPIRSNSTGQRTVGELLDSRIGLHEHVEIHYQVDSYRAELCDDNGLVIHEETGASGETPLAALRLLSKGFADA